MSAAILKKKEMTYGVKNVTFRMAPQIRYLY